jgi:hypothetical protein
LLLLLVTTSGTFPRHARAEDLTITAGLQYSTLYRPQGWQAVRVELRNATDRVVEGNVVLPLAHVTAPARMILPASVPPHARVRLSMWGYFPGTFEGDSAGASDGAAARHMAPLSVVEWRNSAGALLARAEVVGVPLATAGQQGPGEGLEAGEMILVVGERHLVDDEPYDAAALVNHLRDATGVPMTAGASDIEGFPREPAGLRAVRAVVLEAIDPELLDRAQRDALLDYLRSGGIVIVAAPLDAVGRTGGWFEPHFPVRLIGSRMANEVPFSADAAADGAAMLKFRQWLPIVEAVERPGAEVILRSSDYVHLATKSVGLGKVVFTSFPINGLAEIRQPQAAALWAQLLGVRRPLWEWSATGLGEVRHQVLAEMIGTKVAPWSAAAAVAGGYILLVLAAQFFYRGAGRPRAFAASCTIACIISGALLIMGMARHKDTTLQEASLAVVDVGPNADGWRQESFAFAGRDDPNLSLRVTDARVLLRPALADDADRPSVGQQPASAEKAGVAAERIERVWEAAGPADPAWRLEAVAKLGPGGLSLDIDNGTGRTLHSPLVIWNGSALAIADVPAGRSTVDQMQVNARGQFTGLGTITSDLAKRRARIVAASLAPANERSFANAARLTPPPMLVGWVDDAAAASALVRPADRDGIENKSMILVRTPLRLASLPAGSKLTAPPALVSIDFSRMPYDRMKGETVSTPQDGQWLVGFQVPAAVGRVRPTRATLSLRVTLPGHQLTIRKQQCAEGAPKANQRAEPVAAWDRGVGAREADMELGPSDIDRDGRVWLLFDVHSVGAPTGGNPLSWQIADLGLSIDAEVVGPPAPIVLDAPTLASAEETTGEAGPNDEGPNDEGPKDEGPKDAEKAKK